MTRTRTWLSIAALLALPVLAHGQAQPQPGDQNNPSAGMQRSQGAPQPIAIPPGAKLLGTTHATEIREFPEVQAQKKNKTPVEGLIGVTAVDNVYQIDRSFSDTVKFFDQQAKRSGAQVLERTVTPTATAWMVRMPSGNVANALVRNTQPVTFEVIQVAAAAGEVSPPTNP